jgi:hypothetical protein
LGVAPSAEPTQPLWMSLAEALEHIQSTKKCTSACAQVQLKRKIDNGVIPVKWADSEGPTDKPNLHRLARSQFVLSGPGLASSGGSLRPLLVVRSAVLASWPPMVSNTDPSPERNDPSERSSTPDAEYEEDGWMTLVEAIEHIRISHACDSLEALRQLKDEVGDGMIRVGWADSQSPDDRPDVRSLSTSQLLLIGTGIAPDEDEGRYRPLLVDRSDVQRLWPLPADTSPNPEEVDARSIGPKSQKKTRNPDEIRQAARDLYRESPDDSPNMDVAEREIRRRLPGADRDDIRDVLRETEFSSLRKPAGNQPKRVPRKFPLAKSPRI